MSSEVLILSHYDGHGVISACLLARRIGVPPNVIITRYKVTDPENLHKIEETFGADLIYSARTYILVDIAINLKDPEGFCKFIREMITKAQKRHPNEDILFYYIDHHESTLRYMHLLPAAVNIRFFNTALNLSLFCAEEKDEAQILALVAAVCDRDKSVTSHPLWSERRDELLRLAMGVEYLVRNDMRRAIDAIYNYRLKQLESASYNIPQPPSTVDVLGNVVLAYEELDEAWAVRQLEMLCEKHACDYAVGWSYNRAKNVYVVRVVRHWLSDALHPSRLVKGMNVPQYKPQHYGVAIAVPTKGDAYKLAVDLAEQLSKIAVKGVQTQLPFIRDDLLKIMNLLAQILATQRRIIQEQRKLADTVRRHEEMLKRLIEERARPAPPVTPEIPPVKPEEVRVEESETTGEAEARPEGEQAQEKSAQEGGEREEVQQAEGSPEPES